MKLKIDLLKVIGCMLMLVFVSSCESDPVDGNPKESDPIEDNPEQSEHRVFILNQGGWGDNNATLWIYNPQTAKASTLISSIADNRLGDVAQDMLIYGSKLYIAVSESSNIRVLDAATGQDIKTIPIFNGAIPCNPRYLAAHNGKIYASCYNGSDGIVARIDTAGLVWEERTRVGSYPEGIAVNNEKIYVANSGDHELGYDNTVSVVDIANFVEIEKITVGTNPNILRADGNYIYMSYQGDWAGIPGGFQRIDVRDNSVIRVGDAPKADFAIDHGDIYYYDVTYDISDWSTVVLFGKMRVAADGTKTENPLITEAVSIVAPYCIAVCPETGKIYISDAGDYSNPGNVFVFDSQGKKIDEFQAGIIPCKFAF